MKKLTNDIEKAIDALKMDNALMEFDPNTGEERPIEFQNELNQCAYKANLLAISALEKQIPKKPIKEEKQYSEDYGFNSDILCPVCNNYIGYYTEAMCKPEYMQYCNECGQRIDDDWSGEDEECEIRDKVYRNRWIPVSERLPNMEECQKNDCQFIVTDGNRVYEDSFDYMADGYIEPHWTYSTCQPTAWQPLPEPYREENYD